MSYILTNSNGDNIFLSSSEKWMIVFNNDQVSDIIRYSKINYDPHITKIMEKLVDVNKNCICIGANIGVHVLTLSKLTSKNVYCFEPQKKVYDLLVVNKIINSLDNVKCYNIALGDTDKEVNMVERLDNNIGSNCIEDSPEPRDKNIILEKVNVTTLDSYNFTNVGFILLDVEGYEYYALQGGINILSRDKPNIIFECYNNNEKISDLMKMLFDLSYTVVKIDFANYYATINPTWDEKVLSLSVMRLNGLSQYIMSIVDNLLEEGVNEMLLDEAYVTGYYQDRAKAEKIIFDYLSKIEIKNLERWKEIAYFFDEDNKKKYSYLFY